MAPTYAHASMWKHTKPSRRDRYLDAMTAIRVLDIISGKNLTTSLIEEKEAWLFRIWRTPAFRDWFDFSMRLPSTLALTITDRQRRGWSILVHNENNIEISFGPDEMSDVELATVVGIIGRNVGLIHTPVSRPTYDSGTVTIAAAALLVDDPLRAKEFWDLMAAIGIRGANPPCSGWMPSSWGKAEE
jgi:hypothetical protein